MLKFLFLIIMIFEMVISITVCNEDYLTKYTEIPSLVLKIKLMYIHIIFCICYLNLTHPLFRTSALNCFRLSQGEGSYVQAEIRPHGPKYF